HLRGRGVAFALRPQALVLLGAGEVLGDYRGEVEVRLAGLGPHHVEVHLGARGQVLVEGYDDHTPAPRLEVRHHVLDLDHLPGLAYPGDDGEAAAHQFLVAVRGEPVERGARAARAVDGRRGDDDELVGQVEHPAHGAVEQAGARVGEDDRVLASQYIDGPAV